MNFKPLLGNQLVKDLVDRGLVPNGATRVVIDSGNPGGVVRVFSAGFADADAITALMDGLGRDDWDDETLNLLQESRLYRDRINESDEVFGILQRLEDAITALWKSDAHVKSEGVK